MSTFSCCFKTVFHAGEPKGTYGDVLGYDTYQTGDSASSRAIVILTDVFGYRYNNVLLVADQLAQAGFHVLIPDILKDDYVTFSQEDPDYYPKLYKWFENHTPDETKLIVDTFFKKLSDTNKYDFIGTIGYCFGGRYAIQQVAKTGYAHAAAAAHPSLVQIEEVKNVAKPLLISAAEVDSTFTADLRHESEKVLAENGVNYQIDLFGGVVHGFAVRADLSNPKNQYAMDKVILDQIYWFNSVSKK